MQVSIEQFLLLYGDVLGLAELFSLIYYQFLSTALTFSVDIKKKMCQEICKLCFIDAVLIN